MFFLILGVCVRGQDKDLLKGIEYEKPRAEKVTKAFKSTRVINAHSAETLGKENLKFRKFDWYE